MRSFLAAVVCAAVVAVLVPSAVAQDTPAATSAPSSPTDVSWWTAELTAADAEVVTRTATFESRVAQRADLADRQAKMSSAAADTAERTASMQDRVATLAAAAYVSGGPSASPDVALAVLSGDASSASEAADASVLARPAAAEFTDTAIELAALRDEQSDEVTRMVAELAELDDQLRSDRAALDAATARRTAATAGLSKARAALAAQQAALTGLSPIVVGGAPVDIAGIAAVADIPAVVVAAYVRGAGYANGIDPGCQMQWWLLAGFGKIESNHGRYRGGQVDPSGRVLPPILGPPLTGGRFASISDTDGGRYDGDPVWDRAVGPMQFIPSTWKSSGVDNSGDGAPDPNNIFDAAAAAGKYLCRARGGFPVVDPEGFRRAAWSYNRSRSYAASVWSVAGSYAALQPTG